MKFKINNQGGDYPINPGVGDVHYRVADLTHVIPRISVYDIQTLNFSGL
jgi:hypothetical protein